MTQLKPRSSLSTNNTVADLRYFEKSLLVDFINDLCITCSKYSTQVFDWYLYRIQYKKNCFFSKKSLIPLSSLCKLYHETDCHRFDEYKQSHCGIFLGPQSN